MRDIYFKLKCHKRSALHQSPPLLQNMFPNCMIYNIEHITSKVERAANAEAKAEAERKFTEISRIELEEVSIMLELSLQR